MALQFVILSYYRYLCRVNVVYDMDFNEVIRCRYSCKRFDPERRLSREQLDAILEAGRLAPTAKNLQEHHVYVAESPEALRVIDAHSPCRYGAPTVLVVAYDKWNVYTYPTASGAETDWRKSGVEDVAIVATHMMLAATNAGVDSCWVNCVHVDDLHRALSLPENMEIVMLMDLGFAAEGVEPMPNHFARKPLEEMVSDLVV